MEMFDNTRMVDKEIKMIKKIEKIKKIKKINARWWRRRSPLEAPSLSIASIVPVTCARVRVSDSGDGN